MWGNATTNHAITMEIFEIFKGILNFLSLKPDLDYCTFLQAW
jgi:hypothetical protein